MDSFNCHGLKRYIPADVARTIRQECGFGCVRCGKAIYEYHHFDPPFHDAVEHNPAGMVLLCGGCHADADRGWLSTETVQQLRLKPAPKVNGWAETALDLLTSKPVIRFGIGFDTSFGDLLVIGDTPVLRLERPEAEGGPCRLSVVFGDPANPTFLIDRNHLMVRADHWDVTTIGRVLEIRSGKGEVVLRMESSPPNEILFSRISIEHPIDNGRR